MYHGVIELSKDEKSDLYNELVLRLGGSANSNSVLAEIEEGYYSMPMTPSSPSSSVGSFAKTSSFEFQAKPLPLGSYDDNSINILLKDE